MSSPSCQGYDPSSMSRGRKSSFLDVSWFCSSWFEHLVGLGKGNAFTRIGLGRVWRSVGEMDLEGRIVSSLLDVDRLWVSSMSPSIL